MADNYSEVTKETFTEKVLNTPPPKIVLVNFSSDQSGACQIQEPELLAISQGFQGRIDFVKVNVEGHEELTKQWNVDGVPTLIFFKGGQEIYRIKGIVMRAKLKRQIEGVLLTN